MNDSTKCACDYCEESRADFDDKTKIYELPTSRIYFFADQTNPGRLIVAPKKHVANISNLGKENKKFLADFMEDVWLAETAIMTVCNPANMNWIKFGDPMPNPHFHIHLVPKYSEGHKYFSVHNGLCTPFVMKPGQQIITADDCRSLMFQLKVAMDRLYTESCS